MKKRLLIKLIKLLILQNKKQNSKLKEYSKKIAVFSLKFYNWLSGDGFITSDKIVKKLLNILILCLMVNK